MIIEILEGIHEEKYTNVKKIMFDFGFSNYLLETIFTGLEKKGFLKNINCCECPAKDLCNKEKFCKGFNSYWILTNKGKGYIDNKKSFS